MVSVLAACVAACASFGYPECVHESTNFLSLGAAGFVGLVGSRAYGQPASQAAVPVAGDDIPIGKSRLGIADDERDRDGLCSGFLQEGTPMPIVVGVSRISQHRGSRALHLPLAEQFGVIVLAPESRDLTWGQEIPGFDTDSRFIGMAYRWVAQVDHRSLAGGDGRCV